MNYHDLPPDIKTSIGMSVGLQFLDLAKKIKEEKFDLERAGLATAITEIEVNEDGSGRISLDTDRVVGDFLSMSRESHVIAAPPIPAPVAYLLVTTIMMTLYVGILAIATLVIRDPRAWMLALSPILSVIALYAVSTVFPRPVPPRVMMALSMVCGIGAGVFLASLL